MARQVDGHHAVVTGEVLHLGVPVAAVATPAMDEDEGGIPLTLVREVDHNTIAGGGRPMAAVAAAAIATDQGRYSQGHHQGAGSAST